MNKILSKFLNPLSKNCPLLHHHQTSFLSSPVSLLTFLSRTVADMISIQSLTQLQIKRLLFLLLFSVVTIASKKMSSRAVTKARYDNYALYRLHIKTEVQVKILQELEERSDSYVFYGHALRPDQKLTIMAAAHKLVEIEEILERYGIGGEILVSREGGI